MERSTVTMRISASALARIEGLAAKAGVTRTEVLRLMLAHGEAPATAEFNKRAKELEASGGVVF